MSAVLRSTRDPIRHVHLLVQAGTILRSQPTIHPSTPDGASVFSKPKISVADAQNKRKLLSRPINSATGGPLSMRDREISPLPDRAPFLETYNKPVLNYLKAMLQSNVRHNGEPGAYKICVGVIKDGPGEEVAEAKKVVEEALEGAVDMYHSYSLPKAEHHDSFVIAEDNLNAVLFSNEGHAACHVFPGSDFEIQISETGAPHIGHSFDGDSVLNDGNGRDQISITATNQRKEAGLSTDWKYIKPHMDAAADENGMFSGDGPGRSEMSPKPSKGQKIIFRRLLPKPR